MSGERHIYRVLQECVHACLPKLYDVTIADGTTTVIEEYVEGRSLGMVKLSAKQFRCVVGDLCSVLEYLHGKGIIHRDIKPSNIIYKEDGHICLIDFDAARMPKDDLEQDTRLLGTRGYAPPEQYGFSQTDARADIYSMGVMLAQLMEGQIYRRRYRRVVKKCMNLNPDKRYQTVRQVRRAFFPAKRNACFILVLALPVCMFWNDIETLSKKMVAPAVSEVSEILYDGDSVYGYLGMQVEDIADERGKRAHTLIIVRRAAVFIRILESNSSIIFTEGFYRILLDSAGCTYEGYALNQNRDKLIEMLGNPSGEGWVKQSDSYVEKIATYYMEYLDFADGIDVGFYLSSPEEQAFMVLIW